MERLWRRPTAMFRWLWDLSFGKSCGVFLLGNYLAFGGSIFLCWALGRVFASRRVFDSWQRITVLELTVALLSPAFNTVVSIAGWYLWKQGWIELIDRPLWRSVLDVAVMLLVMDCGMYFLHRLAHCRWIFPLFHTFHHRHDKTHPMSLFVMHPLETVLFGMLMILFLVVYAMSPIGLMTYLTLNLLWGTLGHCGVEPFPRNTLVSPVLRYLGSSTFHAEHHEASRYNFGFYTLIWDHIFGTLHPDYAKMFHNAVSGVSASKPAAVD